MKYGCSSFSWETIDHNHLLGRTYDQFGTLEQNCIAFVPSKTSLQFHPNGEKTFDTRYPFVGMAVMGLASPILVDGVNESGLMGACLHYPEYAFYQREILSNRTEIHPAFLLSYLLGNCHTVEEACHQLNHLVLSPDPIFGEKMPVHYIFCDKSGESIIIEPDKDGLTIHRNTLGVLTNSPDYSWHKTNLTNYLGATNLSQPERMLLGKTFAPLSETSGGWFGLPGDFSSTTRFVRTAFLKNDAVKGKDEIDGISRMIEGFSVVTLPEGLLKKSIAVNQYEQTLCKSIMCAESATYYFSTAKNHRIRALCLNKIAPTSNIRYFPIREQEDILYLQ